MITVYDQVTIQDNSWFIFSWHLILSWHCALVCLEQQPWDGQMIINLVHKFGSSCTSSCFTSALCNINISQTATSPD